MIPDNTQKVNFSLHFLPVIYLGDIPWDGAKNLHELLDIPPELAQYKDKILDYRINLLEIRSIEDLEHYHGELKAFLGFLKYGK